MIVAAHKCNATLFSPPAHTALDLTCSLSKQVKKSKHWNDRILFTTAIPKRQEQSLMLATSMQRRRK